MSFLSYKVGRRIKRRRGRVQSRSGAYDTYMPRVVIDMLRPVFDLFLHTRVHSGVIAL